MSVCDFNCFECIYSDCVYDSSNDDSGQYFDALISSEIDFHLLSFNPTIQKNKFCVFSDEQLARMRQYYQEHRKDILAYQRKYYQDHREEILARKREYRLEHKEEILAREREYRLEHKEEIRAYNREYYRKCFIYGLGRELRVKNKNLSINGSSVKICSRTSDIKIKKSYKERIEEINARQKKYYQDHKEEISFRNRKYYQGHREEICAHHREYYRNSFIYGLGRKFNESK